MVGDGFSEDHHLQNTWPLSKVCSLTSALPALSLQHTEIEPSPGRKKKKKAGEKSHKPAGKIRVAYTCAPVVNLEHAIGHSHMKK